MGYGLFPGSGLASAEDMLRVSDRNRKIKSEIRASNPPRSSAPEPASGIRPGPTAEASHGDQGIEPESPRERTIDRKQEPVQGTGPLPIGPHEDAGKEPSPAPRSRAALSAVQRRKLAELYQNLHGGSEADAARGLDALFVQAFKHGVGDASYEEGARITAQLLAAQRAR